MLGRRKIEDPNLTGHLLADEAGGELYGIAALVEAEALDVRVSGDPLGLGGALDLLDLHRGKAEEMCCHLSVSR